MVELETDWSCIMALGTELLEKCDLRKLAAGEERRMTEQQKKKVKVTLAKHA